VTSRKEGYLNECGNKTVIKKALADEERREKERMASRKNSQK
jgi:hypothetical protein